MSRRREAAELARALRLSTQEATLVTHLSPHRLSSSKSGTQDSKEMELRAFEIGGGVAVGMLPMVRPMDVKRPPGSLMSPRTSAEGQGSRSDSIRWSHSNSVQTSAIHSFTPSHSVDRNDAVPASSSHNSKDNHISSPMLPPQSRLSATEKSVSSSGSSHRPLFSPTKTSAIKVAPSLQPTTVTTYSSRTDSPSKTKSAQPLFDPPYVSSSPTSESAPVHPATVERKVVAWSSDHEIEEQIEEARGKSRSNLEVLMPAKEKSRSRAHSPDPLDSLPNWTAMAAATDAPPRVTASSPLAPTSENRQIASASTTIAGRGIEEKASGSTRRGSSRVQDKEAKRAFEKAERRRKQALEKEAEAKKEAKKATERDGEAANKQSAAGDAPRRIGRETRQSPIKRLTGKGVESERYIKENPRAEETHEKDDHDSRSSVIESPLNPVLPVRPGNAQTVSRSTARAADRSKKRKADALEHDHDDDDGASWDGEIQEKKSAGKREGDAGKAKGGRKPPLQKNPAKEVVPEEAAVTVETSTFDVQENAEDMSRSPDKQKDPSVSPIQAVSPLKQPSPLRPPLKATPSNLTSAPHRPSPGPSNRPGGIKWKTARSDLTSVLSKFPSAKSTGMSKRLRIAPLHMKIGPPAKALPPVPLKPVRKKKGDSDEDEEEEGEAEEESDGEGGVRKVGKRENGRGMEWFMVED